MNLDRKGKVVETRTTWQRMPASDSQLFMLVPTASAAAVPASLSGEAGLGTATFNALFPPGTVIPLYAAFELFEGLDVVAIGQVMSAVPA